MMEEIDGKLVYEIIRDLAFLIFFAYMFLIRRSQASKDSVQELKEAHGERLIHHSDRLTKIETLIEKMPDHAEINLLHKRVGTVKDTVGDIKANVATALEAITGLKGSVDTLNNHHINKPDGANK